MIVREMGRVFLKEQVMKSGLFTLPVSGICWEWRKGRRDELQTSSDGRFESVGRSALPWRALVENPVHLCLSEIPYICTCLPL